MPYLECKNIYAALGTITVDASFCVNRSKMTCIIGASGAGKSTILRIIAGLHPVDKTQNTSIVLDKKDITYLPPNKRECGMVFQNSSLFMHMTVEDNVSYGLICRGIKKKKARFLANEFLKTFELDNFSKRYPETLSGGEAQRVALARTLIVSPKLLLLDEPLSALDTHLRHKLSDDIKNMQKKMGFTAIMVTHDLEEAMNLGDNIIVLNKGKIAWQGEAKEFSPTYFSS